MRDEASAGRLAGLGKGLTPFCPLGIWGILENRNSKFLLFKRSLHLLMNPLNLGHFKGWKLKNFSIYGENVEENLNHFLQLFPSGAF